MAIQTIPAPSAGGGISSVQRGSAGASGNVTITSVDIAKSFVTIFGSASSGTVAASGAISAANGTWSASNVRISEYVNATQSINNLAAWPNGGTSTNAGTRITGDASFTGNATNLSGGTNNLVAAVVTGFLANATTLTVSGACRYEVVEFA